LKLTLGSREVVAERQVVLDLFVHLARDPLGWTANARTRSRRAGV
jgi:hypothetical protein